MKIAISILALVSSTSVAFAADPANPGDPNLKKPSAVTTAPKHEASVLGKGTDCPECQLLKSAGNADCGQDDCHRIKDKKPKKTDKKSATTQK